ncbi:MAG: AAA family ATPase [Phycisphaeraceae bacterium]
MSQLFRFVCTVLSITAKDLKHRLLSVDDRDYLMTLGQKLGLLCDHVKSAALGFSNGLFIHGRPGTGKTHTVTGILKQLKIKWVLCNSQMTPRGLFDALKANPSSVFLLDDVHTFLVKPEARQVLLAACGGDLGKPRLVTYTTARDGREEFLFTGSIIVISNRRMRDNDEIAKAVSSRLFPFHYDPSDGEILAMTRARCLRGKDGLTARECFKVLDLVAESGKRFDLRTLDRALASFRFSRHHRTCQTWEDRVLSMLDEHVNDEPVLAVTRQDTKDHELKFVSDLLDRFPDRKQRAERERQWSSLTGKSSDSLYRRMRELKAKRQAA